MLLPVLPLVPTGLAAFVRTNDCAPALVLLELPAVLLDPADALRWMQPSIVIFEELCEVRGVELCVVLEPEPEPAPDPDPAPAPAPD